MMTNPTTTEPPLRAGFRDAIHVPYIVVSCNAKLAPGDKCSLRSDGRFLNTCVKWDVSQFDEYENKEWHGVADPWRETAIEVYELFRLYIRKECFSGLRTP